MVAAGRDLARMQDYIAGRLSDDERRTFEDRLVCDPELARELEQSLRMREGLRQLRAQGYFARVASRRRSFQFRLPALAAAVVAGLALFLWVQRERGTSPVLMASLQSHSAANVAPSVTAHFTFVSVRGGSTPDLDLPPTGLIEIRAAPAMRLADPRFRLSLVRRDGAAPHLVGALAALALSADGYVHCYADASHLTPGSYVLRIEPETTSPGIAEAFAFNLRSGATQPSK